MARVPFIAGNWKLNKTVAESLALVTEIKNAVASVRDVEVAVAPVFTALAAVAKRLEGTAIGVAAQDCYWEDSGAWTGQVSVPLLKDVGCTWVIVGHSERRQHFGETDAGVNQKAKAVLKHGLKPIICIGETLQERDANQTLARVGTQLHAALEGIVADDARKVVIAYEPVWAIGTGRNATPAQAQEVHAFIRKELRSAYREVADEVRIQYGGSVKPDNVATLMAEPDIDGALVGGASLTADSFIKLVRGGQQRLRRG
jgi:triosephosphate isomerase